MSMEALMEAHSTTLRHGDLDPTICCHVTRTIKVPGNCEISEAVPLNWALLEPFDDDYHFTSYRCSQSVRCVKADWQKYDLSFRFCAVDLDFANHDPNHKPTRDDFCDLCLQDLLEPAILYETRNGARAIWLVDEITNPNEFEAHYQSLLTKLDAIVRESEHLYRVDVTVRDWGRLYRAPLVVRADENGQAKAEYARSVRLFHTNELDLRTFEPRRRAEPKPLAGNQPYVAHDSYLLRSMAELTPHPGNRNATLLKLLSYTWRKYERSAAQRWVENLRWAAAKNGIDDSEFEGLNTKAQRYAQESKSCPSTQK